jgi:hypothetical protein
VKPPGRPRCPVPDDVIHELVRLRQEGLPFEQVSAAMNANDWPTPTGCARWHTSYVHRVLSRPEVKVLIASEPEE